MIVYMINIEREKLCLSWDLNLRSPVLRTGLLPLRHNIPTQNETSLPFIFQPKTSLGVFFLFI